MIYGLGTMTKTENNCLFTDRKYPKLNNLDMTGYHDEFDKYGESVIHEVNTRTPKNVTKELLESRDP